MSRTGRILASLSALAVVAGLCVSSSVSGASSGNAKIAVGIITSFTGPFAGGFSTVAPGFEARIKMQNAEGGVDGKKLVVYQGDDQGTTSGTLAAAQQLVEQDHVFAVAGVAALTFAAEPYLLSQNVPVTGAPIDSQEWAPPNNNMFPDNGSPSPKAPAAAVWGKFFKAHGVTKLASLSFASPASVISAANDKSSAAAVGIQTPYINTSIPATQLGGFGSVVQQMKSDGVNGIHCHLAGPACLDINLEAEQAGLKVLMLMDQTVANASLTSASAKQSIQDVYSSYPYAPPDLKTPVNAAFLRALKKYEHQTAEPDRVEQDGWIAADLIIKGLELAGPNPTPRKFEKDLRAVKGYTANGMESSPVSFTKSFGTGATNTGPMPKACDYFVQYRGSAYHTVSSVPTCGGLVPNSNAL